MITSQNREEALQLICVLADEGEVKIDKIKKSLGEDIIHDLIKNLIESEMIKVDSENRITLTVKGEKEAMLVIRRHRLAERLLFDVLDIQDNEVTESQACDFEHILNNEVTDSICTLLGHPRFCPDGKPIPPGMCCGEKRNKLESVFVPLESLKAGEKCKVSYMCTSEHGRLDKLSSMGLFPGTIVKVHQRQPRFVIVFEETTLAMDYEIARDIYVKKF